MCFFKLASEVIKNKSNFNITARRIIKIVDASKFCVKIALLNNIATYFDDREADDIAAKNFCIEITSMYNT